MPRCSHIPEKVEKNCTSWTVENFQQNSPAKTLGHAFLFISVLVSDHLMAKLRPRVPQHALPVHRLRHQCCLTRLVNAGDWPRKAKKKYIYIYVYIYTIYTWWIIIFHQPWTWMKIYFWEDSPYELFFILEVEWSRCVLSYTLPRRSWMPKGPQDDLLSTLNHQVKENYLGC